MTSLEALACLLAICFLSAILYKGFMTPKPNPLPPGPKSLPLLGNLFQIPRKNAAQIYASMSALYGPIIGMNVVGRSVIVINSLDIARELFEKRSSIYSHRPRMVMAKELVGRETMLFMNYGARFKKARRLTSSLTHARTAETYWPVQEAETLKFVLALRQSRGNILKHCQWAATSLIIRLVYGIEVKDKDDELVRMAAEFSRLTTEASLPGRWLVDSLPFLRFLPSFFPGAYFKRWARETRARMDAFGSFPYQIVKKNIANGNIVTCWATEQILAATGSPSADDERDIRAFACSLYSGGSDTSGSAVATFILMMIRNPDVQRKAQDEVDAVTGGGCWVPGLRDLAQFPYVGCVVKEVMRMNPVIPLVPHSLMEDDIYMGYRIPKQAWVMANVWSFMYDEKRYPEPHVFRPERFMECNEAGVQEDPLEICFGFGRRACPGRHFGYSTVFISILHLLFAFDMKPEKDSSGSDIIPPVAFSDGHIAHPKPFPYQMVDRSSERISLLEHALSSLQGV